jgi:hypothetical protein
MCPEERNEVAFQKGQHMNMPEKSGYRMNGFYTVYYTGKAGSGFAIIVFKDGLIIEADASGGLYDGQDTIRRK